MNTQAHKLKSIVKEKRVNAPVEGRTKILAIASGKGGVGKSIIAANIAADLAKRGYKVGIFDAAIGLANLDIIFNVKVTKNLLNVLKGECELSDIVTEISPNLLLIPGDSGDEIFHYDNQTIYDRLLSNASFLDALDYLIIDTASGIGTNVRTFLQHADEVIVITAPEPTSITDAYALIKITSQINENLNLIVNFCEDEKEGRFIYERIKNVAENNLESKLFLNYLGSISTSRDISNSSKYRQLFSQMKPNAFSTMELTDIIDNIIFQLEHQVPVKKARNSFTLFIKRLIDNF